MHKLPVNKFSDMASVRWRKIGLTVRTKPERNRGKKTKPERSLCLDRAGWAVGGTPSFKKILVPTMPKTKPERSPSGQEPVLKRDSPWFGFVYACWLSEDVYPQSAP